MIMRREDVLTNIERAQYELFESGMLERSKIEEWVRNDLRSSYALLHSILSEKIVFDSLVDVLYAKYKGLHADDVVKRQEKKIE